MVYVEFHKTDRQPLGSFGVYKDIAAFFGVKYEKRGMRKAELAVNKTGDKLQQTVGPLETHHATGHVSQDFLIIEFWDLWRIHFRRHKNLPRYAGLFLSLTVSAARTPLSLSL